MRGVGTVEMRRLRAACGHAPPCSSLNAQRNVIRPRSRDCLSHALYNDQHCTNNPTSTSANNPTSTSTSTDDDRVLSSLHASTSSSPLPVSSRRHATKISSHPQPGEKPVAPSSIATPVQQSGLAAPARPLHHSQLGSHGAQHMSPDSPSATPGMSAHHVAAQSSQAPTDSSTTASQSIQSTHQAASHAMSAIDISNLHMEYNGTASINLGSGTSSGSASGTDNAPSAGIRTSASPPRTAPPATPRSSSTTPTPASPSLIMPRPQPNQRAEVLLAKEIKACTDWLELCGVFNERRQDMNARHLTSLVGQLTKVDRVKSYTKYEDTDFHDFLSAVAADVAAVLPQLAARDMAYSLWAFAKLGFHPGNVWMGTMLEHLGPLLLQDRCDPISVSQMIWGLAKLGHQPDEAWMAQFFDSAHAQMASFTPQGLSNIIWAAAALQAHPPSWFLHVLLDRMLQLFPSCTPQALANTLWALATLGVQPGERWMQAFLKAVDGSLSTFGPADFTHTIWGLARMNYQPPPQFMGRLVFASSTQITKFGPQELSNTAWALVVLGHQPHQPWLNGLLNQANSRLPHFSARELSTLMWALAYLQPDGIKHHNFAKDYFKHSFSKLAFFNAQDCANTLWALGSLKLIPPRIWAEAFQEESFTQLPYFSTQHFANIMWGWAKVSQLPPQTWLDRYFLETRPKLVTFKTTELAAVMYAYGVCNIGPPRQWMNQYLLASFTKMELFTPQGLANIIWGMGRLHFKPNDKWMTALLAAIETAAPVLADSDIKAMARGLNGVGCQELPPKLAQALVEVRQREAMQRQQRRASVAMTAAADAIEQGRGDSGEATAASVAPGLAPESMPLPLPEDDAMPWASASSVVVRDLIDRGVGEGGTELDSGEGRAEGRREGGAPGAARRGKLARSYVQQQAPPPPPATDWSPSTPPGTSKRSKTPAGSGQEPSGSQSGAGALVVANSTAQDAIPDGAPIVHTGQDGAVANTYSAATSRDAEATDQDDGSPQPSGQGPGPASAGSIQLSPEGGTSARKSASRNNILAASKTRVHGMSGQGGEGEEVFFNAKLAGLSQSSRRKSRRKQLFKGGGAEAAAPLIAASGSEGSGDSGTP